MWIVLWFVALSLIYFAEGRCSEDAKVCHWISWESWGSCSQSCGGGWRVRTRHICCKHSGMSLEECTKDCNMNKDGASDYGSCNERCIHGYFHNNWSSRYEYGRCICSKEYGGDCCNTALCGWNEKWCWPGDCGYYKYERNCRCDPGFRKEKVGGKTMCQLDKLPTLQTCRAGMETRNGDAVNTTGSGKCSFEQSVYTNLQPYRLSFTIESSFSTSVSSHPSPNRIKVWIFGIVNSQMEVLKKGVTDNKQQISQKDFNDGPECDHAFSDQHPRPMASCTGTLSPGQTLNNGESICVNFIPYAGGHLTTFDNQTEFYKRTNTNKELCFMYDNQKPSHCEGSPSCNTQMLHVNRRITSNHHVNVKFTSWTDPIPNGGSSSKASGIKKFVASFLRVEGLDPTTLVMKYPGSSVTEIKANETEVNFTLPKEEPALYAILLEVHDIAGNVRMARRFVLYDNSSKVEILSKQPLISTTTSAKTNHTWQVNHGQTCLNWTGRYYNTYHTKINLLRKIKADGNITGYYDQIDGLIPVSGTPNVDGIVRFEYTWKIDNGTFKTYSTVSNIYAQSFCENLSQKDGQTYTFQIKPIDINSRFLTENLVIHIDRSPPIIQNIWLVKDGYKQLFIHNSSDLSKMSLQFEAFDFHSGLYSIKWKLGTSDGAEVIGTGSIGVQRKNGTCTDGRCYCPKVGICEQFLYSINLNKLVDNRTNIGQHNRAYYFSIIATNNARLVNIEHTDVLADDSPPEEGVIQEGVVGSPDIDYTNEREIAINWKGFIDHESGIKFYRVGLSSKCLSLYELNDARNSSKGLVVIETTEEKSRFKVDADGFYISSIVAYNNAMEPTVVVCSDGITKDSTAPTIVNVTLTNGKVMEVFACDSSGYWLVRDDLKKVALSPTDMCKNRCKGSGVSLLKSLPEIIVNSTDNDVANHLCQNLPDITENWFIYMPSFNIDISWMSIDANSQIRLQEVGIASDLSGISSPDIVSYRDVHGHTRYHNVHEGIDRGIPFYIMIRSINKAGLENILPFGPIIIDDTPPQIKQELQIYVHNEDDTIYCTWDNETFLDPEQKHAVDYVLFKIGSGDRFFTPLLQIPPDQKCKRRDFQFCIPYPLSKLQRQDEEKGLQFYFELHIYNMAGHFTTVRSPTFILPSRFMPGHGHVIDLDPSSLNLAETDIEDVDDCDVHFNVGNVCAAWKGFYHHKYVLIQVGVGTSEMQDNIIPFTTIEDNNNFMCFNASTLTPYTKYFITLNATCSGGSRVVSSNGVTIIDRTHTEKVASVNIGSVCESADKYHLAKRIDQNNTSVNFTSVVPLKVGHGYTIESNNSLSVSNIHSDDVLWITASYLHGKVFRRGFRAFRSNVTFTVSNERKPEYELLNITLVDCLENIKTTNAMDFLQASVSLHKNFSNFVSRYKASVFKDDCLNELEKNSTCLEEIPRTEIASTTAVFQIVNISLLEGKSYRVGVSVCFKQNCLSPVYSSKIIVQSTSPTPGNFTAHVAPSNTNDTCLQVYMKWDKFSCVNGLSLSEKYQWALSHDQNTEGLLTNWMQIQNDNRTVTDFELHRCVEVQGYLHRPLHACIRTMCESGSSATTCILMQVPHPNSYKHQHVYELDGNNPLLEDIKKKLQAEFLGDTLSLLHKLDIDYCRKDTLLVGAIPNSDERNITWYLLTDQSIPEHTCESASNCVKTLSSMGGLVTLHKATLIPGKRYFICAKSNKTVINRELFNDTLEEINTCGNGFLVDDVKPTVGHVTILNQYQGFLTSSKEMIISWSGFEDRLAQSVSNIASSIYSYSYAIGTSPGGTDIKPFKSVGLSNTVKARDLHLQNGAQYFVTIRAWDHVNFSADAISTPVGVDITPPTKGRVVVGSALRHKYVVSKQNLHVHWNGFKDDESGISHFYIGIGNEPSLDNIISFVEIKDQFADLSRVSLKDGISYYAVLKAVNRAGLWTTVTSDQFILDSSAPTKGVVRDGSHLCSSDVDYQNFTSSLTCHWDAFGDPHSGIVFYRVGLGTDPEQFDIHALTGVGLRTEITWHNNLKAGEKYFATVEACNGAGLCTRQHSDGIVLDDSPPTPGKIHVGISSKHETYQSQRNSISAHWVGFEDPHSDIHHFEWCITLQKTKCDIVPFTNVLLSQSVFKTQLNFPLKKNIYIKLKAYNNAGQYSEVISDSFRVDNTYPLIARQPHFVLEDMQISHKANTQWDNSLVRLKWKFSDPDSPVVKHIVRLVTHHDGKVRREILHLGNEDRVTIQMPENDLLLDGDRYWATVTACNAAGLCTNSTSDDLLIDSSPPFLGGFKPPMTWENELNKSRVFLTWYGFSDIESGITNYMVSVSKTYSGSELSDGLISFQAKDTHEQNCSILLTEQLSEEDNVILTIWVINGVGLRSEIGKVTVTAVQTDTGGKRGILKLQKHSCITHYCSRDCTCAVLGQKCGSVDTNMTCVDINNESLYQNVNVLAGMLKHHQNLTASSSCLTFHWIPENNARKVLIQRYEWSIGIDKPGDGVFVGPYTKKWFDVGLQTNMTFCMPDTLHLIHGENYTVFIKAWYTESESHTFSSLPVTVDRTPPDIVRGKHIFISTDDCATALYFINNASSITLCWQYVFKDSVSGIMKYYVMAGTSPFGDDLVQISDYGLQTKAVFKRLQLHPGTKYFFTVRAVNGVGLMKSLSSDGIVLDEEPPFAGVVFNTFYHKNEHFQADSNSFSASWHGFGDHHSYIRHYSVWLTETRTGRIVYINDDVGIETSFVFNETNLQQNESYKVSVKAWDAAGYESEAIDSEILTIDLTPPSSFKCKSFIKREHVCNSTLYTEEINFEVPLQKDIFYKVIVDVISFQFLPSVELAVGHHFMVIPTAEKSDHTKVAELAILSPYNETTSLSANFGKMLKNTSVCVQLLECAQMDFAYEEFSIDVMQISPSLLSVCSRILDKESGVKTINIGIGTTKGGFQVYPLTSAPVENHIVLEHISPHGAELYVTAVAHNNAGLVAVFSGKKIVVDHTAPEILNVTAELNMEPGNVMNNTYERLANITVIGSVLDKETGIQRCSCLLETRMTTGNLALTGNMNSFECVITDFPVVHGVTVQPIVTCTNNVELVASETGPPLLPSFLQPSAENANLQVLPYNDITSEGVKNHRVLTETVQANRTILQARWSGFHDASGIDHYEYSLLEGNDTVSKYTEHGSGTAAVLKGLSLTDGRTYTLSVEAVNVGGIHSNPLLTNIKVESKEPEFSGRPAELNVGTDGSKSIEWKYVFLKNDEMPMIFDINIGSREGFCDIINRVETMDTSFVLPETEQSSLWLSVCARYVTGKAKCHYQTLYTV